MFWLLVKVSGTECTYVIVCCVEVVGYVLKIVMKERCATCVLYLVIIYDYAWRHGALSNNETWSYNIPLEIAPGGYARLMNEVVMHPWGSRPECYFLFCSIFLSFLGLCLWSIINIFQAIIVSLCKWRERFLNLYRLEKC